MKKILTLILITTSSVIYSQNRITYISPNRDTLLVPNDEIGVIILKIWENPKYNNERPLIVMVPIEVINNKNEYYLLNENKKRKNINHVHAN